MGTDEEAAAKPDRVMLVSAAAGVASAALPLVTLRPNRLADGVPQSLSAGGAWGWSLLAFAVAGLAAAFVRDARVRGRLGVALGGAMLVSLAFAVGHAALTLVAAEDALARVSVGTGGWIALLAAAALAFAGDQALGRSRFARLALAAALAVGLALAFVLGGLAETSLAVEYEVQRDVFWRLLRGHLALSGASLLAAIALGVPLGVASAHSRRVRSIALSVTGAVQTVPSLALLGLLVAPLAALAAAYPALRSLGVSGIGFVPALIALTLYAVLPVLRDTYLGLESVDPSIVDAGRGMGMTRIQLLARVRAPLALPLVFEGVRIAAVLIVGIATVTALAGARTLGRLVFDGLAQGAVDLTLLGALPIIVLAVVADRGLRALSHGVTPKGVRA